MRPDLNAGNTDKQRSSITFPAFSTGGFAGVQAARSGPHKIAAADGQADWIGALNAAPRGSRVPAKPRYKAPSRLMRWCFPT